MMKKIGYTLSEIVIALGLVSVIAVITAPLIGNILPDKNKITVLKTYKIINDTVAELLNDPSKYRKREITDTSFVCPDDEYCYYVGLGDTTTDVKALDGKSIDKNNKFIILFGESLHATRKPEENSSYDDNIKASSFYTKDGVAVPYTNPPKDAIKWIIETNGDLEEKPVTDKVNYYGQNYKITIDINGDGEGLNKSAVKNADQYIFNVRYDGLVTGGDDLTRQYLKTADKLNNKKEDYE
ncbi:type II secretion system protein, partial [bacterium]|nr:type II secretion system protein [bacterium]